MLYTAKNHNSHHRSHAYILHNFSHHFTIHFTSLSSFKFLLALYISSCSSLTDLPHLYANHLTINPSLGSRPFRSSNFFTAHLKFGLLTSTKPQQASLHFLLCTSSTLFLVLCLQTQSKAPIKNHPPRVNLNKSYSTGHPQQVILNKSSLMSHLDFYFVRHRFSPTLCLSDCQASLGSHFLLSSFHLRYSPHFSLSLTSSLIHSNC